MSSRRKRNASQGRRQEEWGAAAAPPRDLGAALAAVALAVALSAASLLVDPRAESAFDAPKRLAALVATALAVTALALGPRPRRAAPRPWRAGRPLRRAALLLLLFALAWAFLAALVSPRRGVSLDTWRVLLLSSLLVPLGASQALEGRRGRLLLAVFLGAAGMNAVVSLLQASGVFQPFPAESLGGRLETAAFVGNEGVLALALALAAVAALAVVLQARVPLCRIGVGATLVALVGSLAVARNLTALVALLAGALAIAATLFGRRAIAPAALALLVAGGSLAAHAPLRHRAAEALADARAGDWDRALTYRLGPWTAALEMARARPLTGWGPGTFGAEFVPHRLQAELRFRTRFVNPFLAGSYTEAHSEPLQAAAEAGVPAGVALIVAAGALLAALLPVARNPGDPRRPEAVLLLALLGAGAAGALTWFPLQRPVSAVPLLLAAGRAWRICGDPAEPSERARLLPRIAVALVVAALLLPELPRYAAERRLYAARAVLEHVAARRHAVGDVAGAVAWGVAAAFDASRSLPGDPRPRNLAGAARLIAAQPTQALDRYREALTLGERPEIVFNLGRAYQLLGRRENAEVAFLRAVWVSPAILAWLPPSAREPFRQEIARLEQSLRAGRLPSPPPLPP